jgi:hypothetical protein
MHQEMLPCCPASKESHAPINFPPPVLGALKKAARQRWDARGRESPHQVGVSDDALLPWKDLFPKASIIEQHLTQFLTKLKHWKWCVGVLRDALAGGGVFIHRGHGVGGEEQR